jgi:hypothetical protein
MVTSPEQDAFAEVRLLPLESGDDVGRAAAGQAAGQSFAEVA